MANGKTQTTIIHRRCDIPMRRSKEQARGFERWKCNNKCNECICCIEQDINGFEAHVNLMSQARKRDDISD